MLNFHHPACSNHQSGVRNNSLLAAFYRYRDPGLPPAMMGCLISSKDGLSKASGFLAKADNLRNLGMRYEESLVSGFAALRRWLGSEVPMESLLPNQGPPQHLIWHFLDKLSLPLQVTVQVQAPEGYLRLPAVPQLSMRLLPDHDIISDHIRRTATFHCPGHFMQLVGQAAASKSDDNLPLRIAEVGGFLGDCILWAVAWLGTKRLRALEVEPVAAAMARFKQSLATAGLEDTVTIVTEAIGNCTAQQVGIDDSCGGPRPANPNFRVLRSVPLANKDPAAAATVVGQGCNHHKLRCLDEVLKTWTSLKPGEVIDLVRVKAAGSEPLIIAGLHEHIAGARVQRILVETGKPEADEINALMTQFPHYRFDSHHLQRSLQRRAKGGGGSQTLLYELVL